MSIKGKCYRPVPEHSPQGARTGLIYLVNGIKLQGQIESFDQYVVLLKNTVTQMVYKHPSRPSFPHAPLPCRRTKTIANPDPRFLADRPALGFA